jgi:hypothetical protein
VRIRLALTLTVHRDKQDEADEYRETDRYSTTERADTKHTREASTIGFIVEPYE